MRISILPKTLLGKWSAYLAAAFILTFALTVSLSVCDVKLPSIVGVILGLIVIIFGIACFVIGLISIIKNRERSILAFLATLIGLFAIIIFLIMFIGETFFP
jgi:hypothetical protein